MARTPKKRIDVLLVERGLVESLARAQAIILAGKVFSAEQRLDKAGTRLSVDAPLEVRGRDHPYVSRGGVKLEGALEAFGLDPAGLVVADFGASTGGFTDCLLQRGASRVYAIDVGYGQLAHRLRQDPRVVVMERTNARHLTAEDLPEAVGLVVIDASFISIAKLLPAARRVLAPGGEVVGMVKPQFEVGRTELDRGVVRDPEARARAIDEVASAAEALGFEVRDRCDSSLAGPEGNVEAFLRLAAADRAPGTAADR
ncbi:MAG TPA: TlyA family RNA methyltransferase [Sandaracinaceae bacterium LLY-WYZ-13_1]|nr:TlyA family RNA methyltransferase [Sandaracinaceae bacterium LLY-WYZ-13_1]